MRLDTRSHRTVQVQNTFAPLRYTFRSNPPGIYEIVRHLPQKIRIIVDFYFCIIIYMCSKSKKVKIYFDKQYFKIFNKKNMQNLLDKLNPLIEKYRKKNITQNLIQMRMKMKIDINIFYNIKIF